MKLCRYEHSGTIGFGAVTGSAIAPCEEVGLTCIDDLIALPRPERDAAMARLADKETTLPLATVRLLAPLTSPGKYLAIGMNYADHVAEVGQLEIPAADKQVWFNKQTSCLSGPFDPIVAGNTEQLDYEVELGVVIGTATKNVGVDKAAGQVFGYFVANDVSSRDYQFHSPTHTIGKSFDTHGPIGPWIVTADEIPDPHSLQLRCLVNGEVRQDANTSQMVSNIWEQIAYLSSAFTLFPGDIIATGTPSGVGIAMSPPKLLKSGDVVRCEIENIGWIENCVL